MKWHMESCSNQKSVKQIKIYFRFFKVKSNFIGTYTCLADVIAGVAKCLEPPFALMIALNTLGSLSTSFTWNAFPTVLKEFPHAEQSLAAFTFNFIYI